MANRVTRWLSEVVVRGGAELAGKAWGKVFGSAEKKAAEAAARTERAFAAEKAAADAEKAGLPHLATEIRQSSKDVAVKEATALGPLAKAGITLGIAGGLYATPAVEGYVAGRMGDPNSNSTGQLLTTPFSAVADLLEVTGNSKANFITDAYVGAYAIGNDARFQNATPEERKKKGLVDSWTRAGQLAKTESHRATSTSYGDYAKDRGTQAAADTLKDIPKVEAAASAAAANTAEQTRRAEAEMAAAQSKLRQSYAGSIRGMQDALEGKIAPGQAPDTRTEVQKKADDAFIPR